MEFITSFMYPSSKDHDDCPCRRASVRVAISSKYDIRHLSNFIQLLHRMAPAIVNGVLPAKRTGACTDVKAYMQINCKALDAR